MTKADLFKMGATAAITALFTAIAAYVAMRVEQTKLDIEISQLRESVQEIKLERDKLRIVEVQLAGLADLKQERDKLRLVESQLAGLADLKQERDKLRLVESQLAEHRGEFRVYREEMSRVFRDVSTATRGGLEGRELARIWEEAARRLQMPYKKEPTPP